MNWSRIGKPGTVSYLTNHMVFGTLHRLRTSYSAGQPPIEIQFDEREESVDSGINRLLALVTEQRGGHCSLMICPAINADGLFAEAV